MQYELTILDDLVLNKLNPHCSNLRSPDESLEQCVIIAHNSKLEIEDNFLKAPLRLRKSKLIQHYFYTHQVRLIFLCDFLFGNIFQIDKSLDYSSSDISSPAGCMRSVYNILDNLLNFILSHFCKYFSFNLVVPEKSKRFEKRFIRKLLVTVDIPKFNKIRLWDLTFKTISDFLDEKGQPFTYNNITYIKEVLVVIIKISDSENNYTNEVLKSKLISYNLNSSLFYDYLIDEIIESVRSQESIKLQLEKYYWHLKQINQIPSFTGKSLIPDQISIKEMLCCWITEEINYLERSILLTQIPGNPNQQMAYSRFITTLSVPQLAYLARLFVETDIIKAVPSHQELFRSIAGTLQTMKSESLSVESIKNKFYTIEDSTRQHVKSLIIKLLNEINKN